MQIPNEHAVLAKISHLNSLGVSEWFEVVHHDGVNWVPFFGSKTFSDGEIVKSWKYCSEVTFNNGENK